ncbi:DUF397 domain-containing protein [Streptomyces sp. NPDC004610]|uniref:DUF397 domain-containing protein n=1 Tax=unclassified Streptomyces TaxID=2593676 RepID=UPI0033BD459B
MAAKPEWRTSSYTKSDSCVEVADNDPSRVLVRDTKFREVGHLSLNPPAWGKFIGAVRKIRP